MQPPIPLDLAKIRVFPLAQRKSMSTVDEVLIEPSDPPPPVTDFNAAIIERCARDIKAALERNASVMFIRSEERRVGKECQSVCRSRWSPYH